MLTSNNGNNGPIATGNITYTGTTGPGVNGTDTNIFDALASVLMTSFSSVFPTLASVTAAVFVTPISTSQFTIALTGQAALDLGTLTGSNGFTTGDLQTFSLSGATANTTKYTLTFPVGAGFPTAQITYTGTTATDTTTLQTDLNTALNTAGYTGNPATVALTGSSVGSETFSIDFGGSMTGVAVPQLTANLITEPGTLTPGTLPAAVAANNANDIGNVLLNGTVSTDTAALSGTGTVGTLALTTTTTSDVQTLTLASVAANTTTYTLTYPNGSGNPTTPGILFTNSAADATTIQTDLNTIFNGLGFTGTPVTVTRTAGTATSATYSISFGGTMAGINVLQLTSSVTTLPGTVTPATTTTGGQPASIGTVNPAPTASRPTPASCKPAATSPGIPVPFSTWISPMTVTMPPAPPRRSRAWITISSPSTAPSTSIMFW